MIAHYELGFTVPQVRARISEEFCKNMHTKDVATIDFLVFKGTCELEEIRNQWKTKPHVLSYFAPPKEKKSDLFSNFFAKRT